MVFVGFAWFATFLADTDASVPLTVGKALESLYLLGFVYLVLSFPTGRLGGRLDRALFAAGVTVVEVVWLLFADSRSQICSNCPANALDRERGADPMTRHADQAVRVTPWAHYDQRRTQVE
jgi:hypothetical protein